MSSATRTNLRATCDSANPPPVLRPHRHRHRHRRAGVAAERSGCPPTPNESAKPRPASCRRCIRAEGEARHLPLHVRRAVAHRPVRLQAARSQKHHGDGAARLDPHGAARSPGMTSGQKSFPVRGADVQVSRSTAKRARGSASCCRTSATIVDDIAIVKSMHTEAINHDPAITFIQTGSQQPGRPSLGAWLSYGLGSENENLPAFVVMISQGSGNKTDQPIFSRLWGSGFLPIAASGRALPRRRRPGAVPHRTRRASTPRRRRDMLDGVGAAQRAGRRRRSAIPRSTRASRSTKWPTACRRRCRS